jgi:hypothetical protein
LYGIGGRTAGVIFIDGIFFFFRMAVSRLVGSDQGDRIGRIFAHGDNALCEDFFLKITEVGQKFGQLFFAAKVIH